MSDCMHHNIYKAVSLYGGTFFDWLLLVFFKFCGNISPFLLDIWFHWFLFGGYFCVKNGLLLAFRTSNIIYDIRINAMPWFLESLEALDKWAQRIQMLFGTIRWHHNKISFCAITQECLDRFTSNLVCGILKGSLRFLVKMDTRWFYLAPPSGTI